MYTYVCMYVCMYTHIRYAAAKAMYVVYYVYSSSSLCLDNTTVHAPTCVSCDSGLKWE